MGERITLRSTERNVQQSALTESSDFKNTSLEVQRNFNTRSSINNLSYVLLATARVHIHDKDGNKHEYIK